QFAQSSLQAMGMLECAFEFRLHLRAGSLVEVHDDGFLGGVIIVGRARSDTCVLRDAPHGGVVESLLPKKRERGFQDFESCLLCFWGRFRSRHRFERVQYEYALGQYACQGFFERVQFLIGLSDSYSKLLMVRASIMQSGHE